MLNSVSNAGVIYSHKAWQSQRKAKGNKLATKNIGTSDVSITQAAYQSESYTDFLAWLDDQGTDDPLNVEKGTSHGNWVKRTINKVEQYVRPVCSLTCNTPEDVFYDFIQLAGADSDEDKLKDGAVTYLLRAGVWTTLGRADFVEWDSAEQLRISTSRADRMRGTVADRTAKVKGLESERDELRNELAELKAMLAAAGIGKGEAPAS